MAFEVVIPRLGWSMEEGVFVDWLKKPGEFVRRGEPLFELEGEKAIQEVEAVDEGILHLPPDAPAPGTTLPVGAVLGYLLAEGESSPAAETAPPSGTNEPLPPVIPPAASPAARRIARQLHVPLEQVKGSGPGGRVQIKDIEQAARHRSPSEPVALPAVPRPVEKGTPSTVASPRARRVAQELQVDWRTLTGSGAGGRVREADVRQAAAQGTGAQPVAPVAVRGAVASVSTTASRQPVSRRRRVIAERMTASHMQNVPVTLMMQADATNLVNLREQLKQVSTIDVLPSYQDIIVKLVAELLPRHPQLIAQWDQDELVIASGEELHIGIAVDTPDGLLVPVLARPRQLSLLELAVESRRLIDKVKSGQISANALQGSVFTVSNLGAFGVDFFTPVINLPEASILGLGAIRLEPTVQNDGTIAAKHRISMSLSFDHRRMDGAPAAKFLQELTAAIANPSAWLLTQA